jgi:hypothetical protein
MRYSTIGMLGHARSHDPAELQGEMDSLADQYSQLMASRSTERYAFVAAHPKTDYLSNFDLPSRRLVALDRQHVVLVAGGICLEDAWGRPLYLLVYLAAGAVACQFDAWAIPEASSRQSALRGPSPV